MKAEFFFEDDDSAGLWRFRCTCGFILHDENGNVGEVGRIVKDGDTIHCPKCHREYKFVWRGMTVKTLANPIIVGT